MVLAGGAPAPGPALWALPAPGPGPALAPGVGPVMAPAPVPTGTTDPYDPYDWGGGRR